jgi:TRAP-type mannitol/chloroaromatic compound transport system substrate-binding protein
MRFGKLIRLVAAVALVGGLTIALSVPAMAQRTVRWKMQSAFGSKLPHLGTSGVRFSENIAEMTDNKFQIKFYEPGALIPPFECFDSVSKGSLESCWTTPGYHTGKVPAAAFFTTVPFGPSFGEFMAWKIYGGGDELRDEIYKPFNLMGMDCFAIGPETSGWFRKEVTSQEQLRGMKMRFFGLGARVMQKMGLSTQLLAAADIYPALERGVIDATEFSMPSIDIALGFYQIAKFNYFPGWHQQTSVSELLMNRDEYNKLPKNYKAILKAGLGESVMHTYAESEHAQFAAMEQLRDKYGVHVKRWPDSFLAAYEKAWREVVAEESAKDPVFKRVADSYFGYRAKFKIWLDAQKLEPTYLK